MVVQINTIFIMNVQESVKNCGVKDTYNLQKDT
jgi:hypothetical protein